MSSDPILGFPLIDPNQTGKTLTLNTAIDAVAQSMAGTLTIAANSNPTPYTIPYSATPDEPAGTKTALRFFYMNVTGALSGAWTAYMPAGPMAHFWVTNSTTGGYNITIMVSGQTGVTLAPGEVIECYLNGTDVVEIANTGPINFTISPTVPNLPYTDSSTKVGNTAFVQAAIAQSMAYSSMNVAGGAATFSLSSIGSLATATFGSAAGVITSVTSITNAGSGYKVGDVLLVNGGNSDAYVRVATITGSGIASLTIVYGGTGYSNPTTAASFYVSGFAPFTWEVHGAITGDITILLTNGTYITEGQQYIFFNNTTGAHNVTVKCATSSNTAQGTGVVIPQGTSNSAGVLVTTDGETEVWAGNNYITHLTVADITMTGNTSGVSDFTMTPTYSGIGANTSALNIAPSYVQIGGSNSHLAGGRSSSLNIGATNTGNWTGTPSMIDINSNPTITSGATGTIAQMLAISCSISNLAAGATLTTGIAFTLAPAVATGTITTNVGANINPGTAGGTTNIDMLIGTATIPSGAYSIYDANTNPSVFAGPISITAATAATTDFTVAPTFSALASSTVLVNFSPIIDETAGNIATVMTVLQVDPSIGATNNKNWTAAFGLIGESIAPSITSGASGTITGILGLGLNVSNLAAGATLTTLTANSATATQTVTQGTTTTASASA